MGYRIEYDGYERERVSKGNGADRIIVLTFVFSALFFLLVSVLWPEGREVLLRLVIPGQPETTLQAAEAFAHSIQGGETVKDAAMAFCQAVFGSEALR